MKKVSLHNLFYIIGGIFILIGSILLSPPEASAIGFCTSNSSTTQCCNNTFKICTESGGDDQMCVGPQAPFGSCL